MSGLLLANLAVLGVCVLLLWGVSLFTKIASIADIFWGFGFVIVAWTSWFQSGQTQPLSLLVVILVTVWGCRLSLYLLWRAWGKGEDYRYKAMREHHGPRFPLVSLFTVFILQGALIWLVSWPIQASFVAELSWGPTVWLGMVLFISGLAFESVGDFQLARFKSSPDTKGQVMDKGLWRYTRHPNYFGDFLVWWGLFWVTFSWGNWWTIFSPLVMSFLLIKVSGVKLLEGSLRSRIEGYEEYVRVTSSFLPRPPLKG